MPVVDVRVLSRFGLILHVPSPSWSPEADEPLLLASSLSLAGSYPQAFRETLSL